MIEIKSASLLFALLTLGVLVSSRTIIVDCGKCSSPQENQDCLKIDETGIDMKSLPLPSKSPSCEAINLTFPLLLFDCKSKCPEECSQKAGSSEGKLSK